VTVALFGGTFDPPHLGHVRVALAAREQLLVERVLVLPAGDPYHKPTHTAAGHRLAMTRLAFTGFDRVEVDDREIRRSGPTYTVDTLEEIGGRPFLVLGPEAYEDVPRWHRSGDLLAACVPVVVPRPGWAEPQDGVRLLKMEPVDLASSDIRDDLEAGKGGGGAVDPAVLAYILREGLYRPR